MRPDGAPGDALRAALVSWAAVTAWCVVLVRLAPDFLGALVSLAVAATFLGAAVRLAGRRPGGLRAHGIDLAGVLEAPEDAGADDAPATGVGAAAADLARALAGAAPAAARETLVALAVALVVFPIHGALWVWWNAPDAAFVPRLPPDLFDFAVGHLLVVALPEEAFFRGWLQTRLGAAFPRRVRLLGVPVSPGALVLQALLFGAVHAAVDGSPARLVTAFPGLLFGWVRALRGGIGAATVLHAGSNVWAAFLARSFGG